MNVPDEIRKCVAFLQYQPGTGLKLVGTVFFVALEQEGIPFTYGVTARHVVETIRDKGIDGQTYLRMNLRAEGIEDFQVPASSWLPHPTDANTDVAVMEFLPDDAFDMMALPLATITATQDVIERNGIGIGDEVFMVGLFHRHYGTIRNIPILRCGNIAAMPEEPVMIGGDNKMESYLVEIRSIGGLSGSPVFTYLLPFGDPEKTFFRNRSIFLLGLMHGHWNLDKALVDALTPDEQGAEPLNTGISVVVPASKVLETINQERLAQRREKRIQEEQAKRAPVPDRAQ